MFHLCFVFASRDMDPADRSVLCIITRRISLIITDFMIMCKCCHTPSRKHDTNQVIGANLWRGLFKFRVFLGLKGSLTCWVWSSARVRHLDSPSLSSRGWHGHMFRSGQLLSETRGGSGEGEWWCLTYFSSFPPIFHTVMSVTLSRCGSHMTHDTPG